VFLVRFTLGTDVDAADARINREAGKEVLEVRGPIDEQEDLKGVRHVPLALAAFLAVLAVGVVAHALASTVRRRRTTSPCCGRTA
jgi:hypothetical protein